MHAITQSPRVWKNEYKHTLLKTDRIAACRTPPHPAGLLPAAHERVWSRRVSSSMPSKHPKIADRPAETCEFRHRFHPAWSNSRFWRSPRDASAPDTFMCRLCCQFGTQGPRKTGARPWRISDLVGMNYAGSDRAGQDESMCTCNQVYAYLISPDQS